MNLDLSCPDWVERLKSGRSLVPDVQLPNASEGDRAVGIFNMLRLFDVPGTPTMGDAGGEWFRRIVWALFASLDPQTSRRLIKELFILVPKKNNKTTGGALLMLTALMMNQRPRAPFLLTGPVQKTADDAFSAIEGAIALDNVLARKLHVRDHIKTIIHRDTQAKLEIMTFDPDIVTGKKVVGALVDEEHVLGKSARAKKAMVQLRGGMLPFAESFLAIITTQSDEAPAGVFAEDLQRARDIRDGKRAGAVLPVLYEFPRDMQQDQSKPWADPENWPMVTPNLGLSIDLDALRRSFEDEAANGEAALRTWASQHLNVEIGLALMSDRWAGADYWEQQGTAGLTLDEVIRRCEVLEVGLDGGGLDDLFGLSVMGRETGTGHWLHWGHGWAHPTVMERRKSEAARLRGFAEDGDLTLVERIGQDIAQIVDIVMSCEESGKLDKIGVDAAGIGAVVDALVEAGIPLERIVAINQGWRLAGAIKTTERKLAEGTLWHGDSRLMAWNVGNAKIEPRANAVMITKQAAGFAKIDCLMALFNSVELLSRNPQAAQSSIWEDIARERAQGVTA